MVESFTWSRHSTAGDPAMGTPSQRSIAEVYYHFVRKVLGYSREKKSV